jgi:DNA-binding CsgD family transcriptional regulator
MAHGHTGMTPAEAAVMDLWDAGNGFAAIARQLQRPRRNVEKVVTMYHIGDRRKQEAIVRQGSADLLAALQRAAA